jgi:hypothetical protein
MFRVWLSAGVIGLLALGLAATGASAGILGPGLDALKSAVPPSSVEKVHEGHGGMHQHCYRHARPGGVPGLPLALPQSPHGRVGDQAAET